MCDTLCEGVTEGCCGGRGWAGGGTTKTHCEAPHWCVHPQVTEGWRGQPVRLEIRKKGACPGRSCWDSRWRKVAVRAVVMDIMAGLHEGSKQRVFMGATVAMTPLCAHHPLHLASLCTIQPSWQTPQKPMEDWVTKSANCRHSSEF